MCIKYYLSALIQSLCYKERLLDIRAVTYPPVIKLIDETNLNDLILLLKNYGAYMYQKLALKAGFDTFYEELIRFPTAKYSVPNGCFMIVHINKNPVGCVGIKRLNQTSCEMKRMFIRPSYRNLGYGKLLVKGAIEMALQMGFNEMLLDTNKKMTAALKLYLNLGFEPTQAYCENENPNVVFLKKMLS